MEGWRGGCNAYLVNSKSNCECYMVFEDLLFVSNASDGSKIDEIREFLNKNYLMRFLCGFKKFSSQTRQSI